MRFSLKKLGPGLLFAGAAIGVSHLVQSTRAGADYGFGLLWALLLINLIKYPFFQLGPRYASATGKSLLFGYLQLHKNVLIAYFILTLLTMFTIQTAVTIVTAGLAIQLFGMSTDIAIWSVVITILCAVILLIGRYQFLDKTMKVIITILTLSTVFAVFFAFRENFQSQGTGSGNDLLPILPTDGVGVAFLIAFMGWMPAPLDISVWHSLWSLEKGKQGSNAVKIALFDFNIGYIGTVFLGICFVTLGALVMHNSGVTFSSSGGVFAGQLIDMYTTSLGDWAAVFVGIAAFTTMFSTTLTTLDASPRAMAKTAELLDMQSIVKKYNLWLLILVLGTSVILFFFISEMGALVRLATILSFLTAPFYAIFNYKAYQNAGIQGENKLSKAMIVLSYIGIAFLFGFSLWYIISLL